MTTDVFPLIKERGFLQQLSHPEEIAQLFAKESVTCYVGIDPTADSLHIGHLLPLMLMKHLQSAGHRPLIVVGGGTVMVGDPSGKTEMRSLIGVETIEENKRGLRKQLGKLLDFSEGKAELLDNADWLMPLNYISFLREVGSQFSVNRMLQADCYKTRLDRPDGGLSFIELNYMTMQSFDFLHLYREFGCKVQIGGDDQWSNILSGADLIRRLDRGEGHALTVPLIVTSDGRKMGKTEAGAVWLDPDRTSPYEFFQYWRNVNDNDVERFLKFYTMLSIEQINKTLASNENINEVKKVLAFEVTKMIHGEEEAKKAADAAAALFSGGGDISAMPATDIEAVKLSEGFSIIDALVLTGLCKTRSDARRLIQQGGISVNDLKVSSIDHMLFAHDFQDGRIIIKKGKKDFHALTLGN